MRSQILLPRYARVRTRADLATSNGAVLLGAPIWTVPGLAKTASAFWQASAAAVPFLFVHGDSDLGVPLDQSV
eukprot:SAG31_NODE_26275_length_445_cov_0.890173_2_plen_72_part_01